MGKNIFLIGFMGTGKSTIAKVLSKECNLSLVEMDERLVDEAGMSINDIFEKYGEEHFRDMETALIKTIGAEGNSVVSCGGGVPMREVNVAAMRESGIVVYLKSSPQTIYERVKDSTNRPLLNGNMNVDYISKLMEARKPKYEAAADVTIITDGKSRQEICKEVIDKLN